MGQESTTGTISSHHGCEQDCAEQGANESEENRGWEAFYPLVHSSISPNSYVPTRSQALF